MITVTTIGGYLGAGKTTLINHLLRNADGRRLAILVNEFGALPIDADLIEAKGERLISIAGGCICCSFGDDLMGAVAELQQMEPAPDHVLIEASGVAIPGAIAASLSLLEHVSVDGVVVLADAETIQNAAQDPYIGDTILRQLQDADLLVLTKPDLIAGDPQQIMDWLSQHSAARMVTAEHGVIPLDIVIGPALKTPAPAKHADAMYESFVLHPNSDISPDNLAVALTRAEFGVLRAKGFIRFNNDLFRIQTVGPRCDVTLDVPSRGEGIVCIGLAGKLDRPGLEAALCS